MLFNKKLIQFFFTILIASVQSFQVIMSYFFLELGQFHNHFHMDKRLKKSFNWIYNDLFFNIRTQN